MTAKNMYATYRFTANNNVALTTIVDRRQNASIMDPNASNPVEICPIWLLVCPAIRPVQNDMDCLWT